VPGTNVTHIQVADLKGRFITTVSGINTGAPLQLDGSKWAAGTYMIQMIKNDGTVETIKAIKQ
jgi:hypothetical protein